MRRKVELVLAWLCVIMLASVGGFFFGVGLGIIPPLTF